MSFTGVQAETVAGCRKRFCFKIGGAAHVWTKLQAVPCQSNLPSVPDS